jgi:hypothetical protein
MIIVFQIKAELKDFKDAIKRKYWSYLICITLALRLILAVHNFAVKLMKTE